MSEEQKEEKMIVDMLKPAMEEIGGAGPLTGTVDIMGAIVDIFEDEGVKHVFSLTSGGCWGMEAHLQRRGIQRIHVRHEQTATFAADAYGRWKGDRPGVAMIGPGTAIGNATAGIQQGMAAQSPMFVLGLPDGQEWDNVYTAQGVGRPQWAWKDQCKYTKSPDNPRAILQEVKRGFRLCVEPPTGPVGISPPWTMLHSRKCTEASIMDAYLNYTPGTWAPRTYMQPADPAELEKAMKWLMEARKPAIVVGEGVHYDHAEEELNEFVKLTGIPCHARRVSRGAVSEYDPLNCAGRARGRVMRAADRAMVMGLKIMYLENVGYPPFWGPECRYIQAQVSRQNVCLALATDFELIGNCKMMLRQMIDCVKAMGITKPPEKWNDWRQYVVDSKEHYAKRTLERTEKMKGVEPLHPDLFGRLTQEFLHEELNDHYVTVIDGFTASSYYTDWQTASFAGQVQDASETIGIGHGVGMAIGAALAMERSHPILAVIGDGGIGASGMDIETAVRWDIPAVFCIVNNSTMVCGAEKFMMDVLLKATGDPLKDTWRTLPNTRYDKMFAEFGCHSEYVEKDGEVKPALRRSFDFVRSQGKPAVMNVIIDPDALQEIWGTFLCGQVHMPYEWVTEWGKKYVEAGYVHPEVAPPWLHPSWIQPVRAAKEARKKLLER